MIIALVKFCLLSGLLSSSNWHHGSDVAHRRRSGSCRTTWPMLTYV